MVQIEILEFLREFNKIKKECFIMRFAKGLETWIKNRLPDSLRDRLNNNKYRYIIKKEKPIDLIVHVGAHYAEDRFFYEELGAKNVIWIEADPDTYKVLKTTLDSHPKSHTKHKIECALVSSENDTTIEFHRFSGDGASSSIYKAGNIHKKRFSDVRETGEVVELKSKNLRTILNLHDINFNQIHKSMLVIDVQGHELSVLEGTAELISQFDFLKCEVSRVEMYEGGTKFVDLDSFLKNNHFRLSSHPYWRVPDHGDVLYSKSEDY